VLKLVLPQPHAPPVTLSISLGKIIFTLENSVTINIFFGLAAAAYAWDCLVLIRFTFIVAVKYDYPCLPCYIHTHPVLSWTRHQGIHQRSRVCANNYATIANVRHSLGNIHLGHSSLHCMTVSRSLSTSSVPHPQLTGSRECRLRQNWFCFVTSAKAWLRFTLVSFTFIVAIGILDVRVEIRFATAASIGFFL